MAKRLRLVYKDEKREMYVVALPFDINMLAN
jgi:hypothetical protein